MTPSRSTSTPEPASPATTAASRNSPEARGSRPTTATGALADAGCAPRTSAAAAEVLGAHPASAKAPVAVVGRDPRASGEFLEAAVVAGLAGSGVDVLRLGVIPTPGVAYLTMALGATFGVVISASHNPAQDNGIKFFGHGGVKLPDAVEDQIEDRLGSAPETTS